MFSFLIIKSGFNTKIKAKNHIFSSFYFLNSMLIKTKIRLKRRKASIKENKNKISILYKPSIIIPNPFNSNFPKLMSLFVGNISKNASYRDIEKAFKTYGHCKFNPRGKYAFVEFDREKDAEEARESLQGKNFGGGKITVHWSKKSGHFDEKTEEKRRTKFNRYGESRSRSRGKYRSDSHSRSRSHSKRRSKKTKKDRKKKDRSKSSSQSRSPSKDKEKKTKKTKNHKRKSSPDNDKKSSSDSDSKSRSKSKSKSHKSKSKSNNKSPHKSEEKDTNVIKEEKIETGNDDKNHKSDTGKKETDKDEKGDKSN